MTAAIAPDHIQAACCAALAENAALDVGSERACEFAETVCAGMPINDQLARWALASHKIIRTTIAEERQVTDLARVTRDLWGGPSARAWLDQQFVEPTFEIVEEPQPPQPPVAPWLNESAALDEPAAIVEPEPISAAVARRTTRKMERLFRRLNRIDAQIYGELRGILDAQLDTALRKAGAKVIAAVRSKATRQKLGGFDEREQVLGHMAAAFRQCPQDVAAACPDAVWAVLTLDEQEILETAFADLSPRVQRLLERGQRTVVAEIADTLGLSADDVQRYWPEEDQLEAAELATATVAAGMLSVAQQRLRDPAPVSAQDDRTVLSRAPGALVALALTRAAGGQPATSNQQPRSGPTPVGEIAVGTGLATGAAPLRMTITAIAEDPSRVGIDGETLDAANIRIKSVTTWVHTSLDAFIPHLDLDGESWSSEEERVSVCAAHGGSWPGVGVYVPGDHFGCGCRFESELVLETIGETT